MHLVGEDHLAFPVQAELVLGIDEEDAALRRELPTVGEDLEARGLDALPLPFGTEPGGEDAALAHRDIVGAERGLAGGRYDRPRQGAVLDQPARQLHPAELPRAFLVLHPDAGARGTGEVGAHHDLDRDHFERARDRDVGIRDVDQMVGA